MDGIASLRITEHCHPVIHKFFSSGIRRVSALLDAGI